MARAWRLLVGLMALAVASAHEPARGDTTNPASPKDPKAACLTAYENAQLMRKKGDYLGARDAARACTAAECLEAMRGDCIQWYDELQREIPTVVVRASSERGSETAVVVTVDGKKRTEKLDGSQLDLDPGPHTFKFELAGWPTVERTIVIAAGEKARSVEVTFAKPKVYVPPTPVTYVRPIPSTVYVFGATAIGSALAFTGFAISGEVRRKHLQDSCAPFCSASEANSVSTRYVLADVSLGVSLVSLGAAAYFYLTRPTYERAAPPKSSVGVSVGHGFQFAFTQAF